jgi:hypothetical protein
VIRGSKRFKEVLLSAIGFRVCVFGILAWKEKGLYKRTYPSTVLFPFLFSLHSYSFISTKYILRTLSTSIIAFALFVTLTSIHISILTLVSLLTLPLLLPLHLFSSLLASILWFPSSYLNMDPQQLLLDTALGISR